MAYALIDKFSSVFSQRKETKRERCFRREKGELMFGSVRALQLLACPLPQSGAPVLMGLTRSIAASELGCGLLLPSGGQRLRYFSTAAPAEKKKDKKAGKKKN